MNITSHHDEEMIVAITMWKTSVAICGFVCLAYAAVQLNTPGPIPDRFGNLTGCFLKDLDIVIGFNLSISSATECKEYRCGNPDDQYYSIVTCGASETPPGCTKVIYRCLPYPDCCPKYECPPGVTPSPGSEEDPTRESGKDDKN